MGTSPNPARHLYQRRYERRVENAWGQASPEDATHILIEIQHGPYCTSVPFLTGETKDSRRMAEHWASQVERLIQLGYEAGDRSARAEIRDVLGIKNLRV
jgi:hypothetical protein